MGAQLKWAQRERALAEGRDFIKWTFEPMRARNAHFNLNRLGRRGSRLRSELLRHRLHNQPGREGRCQRPGQRSLFASWELNDQRVEAFSQRQDFPLGDPSGAIEIPADFAALLKN